MENDIITTSDSSIDTGSETPAGSSAGASVLPESINEDFSVEGEENEDIIQNDPVSDEADRVLNSETDNSVTESQSSIGDTETNLEGEPEKETAGNESDDSSSGEVFTDLYIDQLILANETLQATHEELVSLHEDIGVLLGLVLFIVVVILCHYIYRFFNMFF